MMYTKNQIRELFEEVLRNLPIETMNDKIVNVDKLGIKFSML